MDEQKPNQPTKWEKPRYKLLLVREIQTGSGIRGTQHVQYEILGTKNQLLKINHFLVLITEQGLQDNVTLKSGERGKSIVLLQLKFDFLVQAFLNL